MKTKTILKTLAVALLMPAMLLTTACSSDDNDIVNTENPANTQKGYTLPVTVNVTRQGDDATRATYNESTKKLSFSAGDKLLVMGNHSDADNFAGTLDYDAVSGKFSGILTLVNDYTGTIDALMANAYAFLLPAGYESYKFFSVSGSSSSPTVYFDHTKAFALTKAAAVEQFSIESATSYSSGFALAPMNAIASFTISGLTANKTVAVSFDTSVLGIIIGGNVTTSAEGVATFAVGVYPGNKLENCTLTVDGNNITMPTKTVEAGHIYNISRSVAAAPAVPTGALSGQFSVSATKQVYFSKGNLQAKIASYSSDVATASEWKFADSQYSYIGNAAGNKSFAVGSWVDLFSWVGNSASNDTYGLITFILNSQANHGNVIDESLKTDWGTAAASSIGTGWRTLSREEWLYLFGMEENNIDKSGHARYRKYFRAIVNNVKGIVVLPDDISGISGIPAESSRGTASSFDGKIYTTDAWTALEAKGCVFLPAGGGRYNTQVTNFGSIGFYWSSVAANTSTNYARHLYFSTYDVNPANSIDRYYGLSVRLVHDVPAGSPGTVANDRSYGDQSDLGTW